MAPGLYCYAAGMTRALAAAFVAIVLFPSAAAADITAFLGANPTPSNRMVRGFAGGFSLLVVGFEFEYAHTSDELEDAAPSLRTFMFNGLLQTPGDLGGFQLYGTAGGGVYRDRLLFDRGMGRG